MAEYGVIAIFSYGIFILYIFISKVSSDDFGNSTADIKYFSWNLSQPAGNEIIPKIIGQLALAFNIHNSIGSIMQQNKQKDNNRRDLAISYTIAVLIYASVGVFGAIGLLVNYFINKLGKKCR